MNHKSIEVVKEIYKPYKYQIKKNAHILESTSGKIVLKEKKNDIASLFSYLESRSFKNFPTLIDGTRDGINIYSYIEDTSIPKEQKALDFMKVIGLLHQKTTYYKDVVEDEFKQIYDNILDTINYNTYFYEYEYNKAFNNVFPSPSEFLLLQNYTKIKNAFAFTKEELESWYKAVQDKKKYRVCQIHNNLSLEHFIEGKEPTLISWDHSTKDSPVIDFLGFYKSSYFDLNMEVLFSEYLKYCPWSDDEKKLFFIVISIPPKYEVKGTNFEIVKNIRKSLDYVYKTENLVRPYYTVKEKEK